MSEFSPDVLNDAVEIKCQISPWAVRVTVTARNSDAPIVDYIDRMRWTEFVARMGRAGFHMERIPDGCKDTEHYGIFVFSR